MKSVTRSLSFAGLALLLAGCPATRQTAEEIRMEEQRAQAVREREQRREAEERRQRLQLNLEDLEAQLAQLQQDLQQLRNEQNRARAEDIMPLEQRLDRLEGALNTLEERRKKDREDIIEHLTNRMAELIASQRPPSSPRGGGQTHVVAPGETISAIAAAYGVSSQAIIRANNLRNADLLRVGQELTIP